MIKLLIADDEPIVIDSIRFVVEKYVDGVEVVGSARSGREAIEKALQLKPDVLFMDIHMPGINAVSYTHLDVYKRQTMPTLSRVSRFVKNYIIYILLLLIAATGAALYLSLIHISPCSPSPGRV